MTAAIQSVDHADRDLPLEQERQLWARFMLDRNPADREALFDLHLPYATALASQLFRGRHYDDVEYLDYVQLACIGLLEAVDRFDATRGIVFRTFATTRIRGSVLNGVVRLSEGQEQAELRAQVRRERFESLNDTVDTRAKDVFHSLASLTMGLAIGFILEDTGMIDRESDMRQHDHDPAYHSLAWNQTKSRLADAVSRLPTRERKVIQYHYFHGLAFDRIGDILGLSKSRISQLHRIALAQLRTHARVTNDLYLIT